MAFMTDVCMSTLRHSSHVLLIVTPWTVACQSPLSMEFSRQEHWSGLPFPPLGDLPNPGIEPMSLVSPSLVWRFFNIASLGSPWLSDTAIFFSFFTSYNSSECFLCYRHGNILSILSIPLPRLLSHYCCSSPKPPPPKSWIYHPFPITLLAPLLAQPPSKGVPHFDIQSPNMYWVSNPMGMARVRCWRHRPETWMRPCGVGLRLTCRWFSHNVLKTVVDTFSKPHAW